MLSSIDAIREFKFVISDCKLLFSSWSNLTFSVNEFVLLSKSSIETCAWTQTDENNLQIGYDRNSELGLVNTFIFTDNTWKKSNIILPGTPMIRAILDGTRDYRSKNSIGIIPIKQNHSIFDMQLFPNPSIDFVEFKSTSTGNIFFEIFDLNGKMVSKSEFKNEHKEDVSNYTKGIYLVKFFNDSFNETKKLIVK